MTNELTTYKIDLDLDPSDRWKQVMLDYKDLFIDAMNSMESIMSEFGILGGVINFASAIACKIMNGIMYREELQSISNISGIPIHKLVLCQICYEMFAACTSVVIKGQNNIHFRTMDWEMEFLKKITIKVQFTRNGKYLFEAITWVGYMGIVTGMSNKHSIAVNYRRANGTLMGNMWRVINLDWPIGYLIRDILENNHSTERALWLLSDCKLVSPCYVTLCPGSGDAYIITRDHDKLVNIKNLRGNKYIVQTNSDDINDVNNIMWSRERMNKVHEIMNNIDISHMYVEDIFDMFDKKPIINEHTIYSTVMIPRKCILFGRVI